MKVFEFHRPTSLDAASGLLRELGEGAMVYAGGTDIIPKTELKQLSPKHLVNIKGIEGLNGIDFDGEMLTLGALVRFNDLIFSDVVEEHVPILTEVSSQDRARSSKDSSTPAPLSLMSFMLVSTHPASSRI